MVSLGVGVLVMSSMVCGVLLNSDLISEWLLGVWLMMLVIGLLF